MMLAKQSDDDERYVCVSSVFCVYSYPRWINMPRNPAAEHSHSVAEEGLRQRAGGAQETQATEHSHSVVEGVEGRAERLITVTFLTRWLREIAVWADLLPVFPKRPRLPEHSHSVAEGVEGLFELMWALEFLASVCCSYPNACKACRGSCST